jgi:hypothetical protein
VPSQPTTLKVTSRRPTSVTFTWRAASSAHGLTGYQVSVYRGGAWILVGRVASSRRQYTLSGLKPGTHVRVAIRPVAANRVLSPALTGLL